MIRDAPEVRIHDGDGVVVDIDERVVTDLDICPRRADFDPPALRQHVVVHDAFVALEEQYVLPLRRRHLSGNLAVVKAISDQLDSARVCRGVRIDNNDCQEIFETPVDVEIAALDMNILNVACRVEEQC